MSTHAPVHPRKKRLTEVQKLLCQAGPVRADLFNARYARLMRRNDRKKGIYYNNAERTYMALFKYGFNRKLPPNNPSGWLVYR